MNDSDIQAIANQVGINTRQLIIDELDRRARLVTGVNSGGPFNQFSVNDQGLILDASFVAITGFKPIVIATSGASGSFASGGSFRPNYNTVVYDPFSTITTSTTVWKFVAPYQKWFFFVVHAIGDPNGFVWTQGDKMQLRLHWGLVGSGGHGSDQIDEFGIVATSIATDLVQGLNGVYLAHVRSGGDCWITIENATAVSRGYGNNTITIFDAGVA